MIFHEERPREGMSQGVGLVCGVHKCIIFLSLDQIGLDLFFNQPGERECHLIRKI